MNDKIYEILTAIGLSENEAKVYLANLELGATSALKLSKYTEIKRTTVYSVLESLQSKGLTHTQTVGFKRSFVAENPEKLEVVLEKRKQHLNDIMPALSSMYLGLQESVGYVKHYQDVDGIKVIYDDLLKELKPKDYYFVISDQQKWLGLDPEYFENFKKERAKRGPTTRLLLQDSQSARDNKKNQAVYNEEVKIFSKEHTLATNMIIVPHKVVIVQTVQPFMAYVIENQSVVKMHKSLFDMLWASL